jgi:small subunit ribosomal protein S2
LEKTQECLDLACKFITSKVANGGVILFVSTKPQASAIIENYAKKCEMPYVNRRWLGGLLTNFKVILKLIGKFKRLKTRKEEGKLTKYTKKEQLKFEKEIQKLEEMIGGIASLEKIPDALFVLDIPREITAVKEANKRKIPIVAICDTNSNPKLVDYPIPANDDATKSIELMVGIICSAVREGLNKKSEIQAQAKEVKIKEEKVRRQNKEKENKTEFAKTKTQGEESNRGKGSNERKGKPIEKTKSKSLDENKSKKTVEKIQEKNVKENDKNNKKQNNY